MKKNNALWLLLLALCSIFAGCKKDNANAATPQDILPPATQTGANTFGCLVNGKVYVPKGSNGSPRPNLNKIFEIFNNKPQLGVTSYRYNLNQFDGELYFGIDSLVTTGIYLSTNKKNKLGYGGLFFNNCDILGYDTVTYRNGIFNITKLDLTTGIISGLFNCDIKPINCDTIRITDGRFDFKL